MNPVRQFTHFMPPWLVMVMSDEDDDDYLISKEHPGRHAREDHDKEWEKLWIVDLDFLLFLLLLPIILNMSNSLYCHHHTISSSKC